MNDDENSEKEIFKEALKEWLDDQKRIAYQTVGQWFVNTIAVVLIGALAYLMIIGSGFKHN